MIGRAAQSRSLASSSSLICNGRTLDDQVGPEDTHSRDTNTGLSGTVGGTEAGEDDGGRAAHRSKERLLWYVSKAFQFHRSSFCSCELLSIEFAAQYCSVKGVHNRFVS